MAWQRSLGEMKAAGALLAQCCTAPGCGHWAPLNLDSLIGQHGPVWAAWARRPPCSRCGAPGHYMASPAASTPYRPLLPAPAAEAARKRFLRSFGFTRRDVARIKALAERAAAGTHEAALKDLDVPYRVGACAFQEAVRSNGEILGEWAGQTLLFWPMTGREREAWARRPRGPRKV